MWIKAAFRRSRGAQVGEESGRGKEGLKKWESTESRNQRVSCRLLHATHSSDIVTLVMIKFKYGFPADFYTEIIWIQLTYYISMYILSKLKTFRRVALWENKTIRDRTNCALFSISGDIESHHFMEVPKELQELWQFFGRALITFQLQTSQGFSNTYAVWWSQKKVFKKWNLNVKEIP